LDDVCYILCLFENVIALLSAMEISGENKDSEKALKRYTIEKYCIFNFLGRL
jgi:hypothetical protein